MNDLSGRLRQVKPKARFTGEYNVQQCQMVKPFGSKRKVVQIAYFVELVCMVHMTVLRLILVSVWAL